MKRNVVAWAALVVSTASLFSSMAFVKPVPAIQDVPPEGQKVARDLSAAFGAVAEFVSPSVVQIRTVQKTSRMAGPRRLPMNPRGEGNGIPRQVDPRDLEEMLKRFFPDLKIEPQQFGEGQRVGTGSGFIYDDKGHILTNNHVVADSESIQVTFHDGTQLSAKVVGTDPASDVAVIQVDATSYRPVSKGNSANLRVGEWVIAIGSPFGLEQTVTAGIISATGRGQLFDLPDVEYQDFIQTDAAINPGNSGGPLVDLSGRVVGINSAIATSTRSSAGVGFAIPIDFASKLADRLIKDGKINRARIGVVLQPITPDVAKQLGLKAGAKGVLITQVVEGTPGEKAGLKVGDIITEFEGQPVLSVSNFRNRVSLCEVGKPYPLLVLREGKPVTLSISLASAETVDAKFGNARPSVARNPSEGQTDIKGYGLQIQELTPELAEQLGHLKDLKGLVITGVEDGSPAELAGLSVGDVITKVIKDQKVTPMTSLKSFTDLASQSGSITLHIQPVNGPVRFVVLKKSEVEKK